MMCALPLLLIHLLLELLSLSLEINLFMYRLIKEKLFMRCFYHLEIMMLTYITLEIPYSILTQHLNHLVLKKEVRRILWLLLLLWLMVNLFLSWLLLQTEAAQAAMTLQITFQDSLAEDQKEAPTTH